MALYITFFILGPDIVCKTFVMGFNGVTGNDLISRRRDAHLGTYVLEDTPVNERVAYHNKEKGKRLFFRHSSSAHAAHWVVR